MLIAAMVIRLMAMVTTNRSIEEAPFDRIGSIPARKMIPLTAAQTMNARGRKK
jgi:hypothetical protein